MNYKILKIMDICIWLLFWFTYELGNFLLNSCTVYFAIKSYNVGMVTSFQLFERYIMRGGQNNIKYIEYDI